MTDKSDKPSAAYRRAAKASEAKSKPEGKRPPGRPTVMTPATVDAILARLMAGETLRSICRDPAMPARDTVYRWILEDKEFSDRYMRARECGLDSMFDEALEIADDSSQDEIVDEEGRVRLNSEFVRRSRLRIDTRKWYLARALPKKYGEKVQIGGDQGEGAKPIQTEHTERVYRYVVHHPEPFPLEDET